MLKALSLILFPIPIPIPIPIAILLPLPSLLLEQHVRRFVTPIMVP